MKDDEIWPTGFTQQPERAGVRLAGVRNRAVAQR